jgi:hypothetical protein
VSCSPLCLVRRQAAALRVTGLHVDVERHLVIHLAIERLAPKDGADPSQEPKWGHHSPAPSSTRFTAPEYARQALVSFDSARRPAADNW